MTGRDPAVEIGRQHVDDDHDVVRVLGPAGYRRTPCPGCPWRVDNTGSFPAGAFAASAHTAADMSSHTFGCHESGTERPMTCAGFLLRGAEHNMAARLRFSRGEIDAGSLGTNGHALHGDYVAMAVANGMDPDDPALAQCRRGSYATHPDTTDPDTDPEGES